MTWIILGVGTLFVLFGFMVFFGAPYVPSQRRFLMRALRELYSLTKDDHLIDVGSGDGVVLREASRLGAKATGYEINPIFFLLSKILSWRDPRVSVRLANFWTTPLPADATIVYAFAVQRDGKRLSRLMQREADRLGRPLRLLCLASPLKDIEPEKTQDAYFLYRFEPSQAKALTV